MTDKIIVAFQAADFVGARYFNTQDCPCARAVKRALPALADKIDVGGYSIHDLVTRDRLFDMGHVTRDGEVIEEIGFGSFSYEALAEAFATNPETQATVTLINVQKHTASCTSI